MTIDTHIHLMESLDFVQGISPADLRDELHRIGIDKAWAFTLNGFYQDSKSSNDALKKACDLCPETYIPFMTVNPREEAAAIEEIERAYYELGMRGMKLHPWVQSFSLTGKWFYAMCEKCAELSIPIITHDGTAPYGESLQACYIAEKFPKLKMILGHSGMNDMWKEALYGAKRLSNVYLCTCCTSYYGLKQMVKEVGSERMLFGSDGGFGSTGNIETNLDKIYQLDLPDSDLENILHKTAERLLAD